MVSSVFPMLSVPIYFVPLLHNYVALISILWNSAGFRFICICCNWPGFVWRCISPTPLITNGLNRRLRPRTNYNTLALSDKKVNLLIDISNIFETLIVNMNLTTGVICSSHGMLVLYLMPVVSSWLLCFKLQVRLYISILYIQRINLCSLMHLQMYVVT